MNWNSKFLYSWKLRGNFDLSFVITTECATLPFALTSLTVRMNWRAVYKERITLSMKFLTKWQRWRWCFECGNCIYVQSLWYTFQFWEWKKPTDFKKNAEEIQLLQQEFNFRLQDVGKYGAITTYFQCYLMLMLKFFQPNLKWRWQMCPRIWTWEIYFDMFYPLNSIKSVYLLNVSTA
jgi:hypothetical protein